jgi:hypothetical protein
MRTLAVVCIYSEAYKTRFEVLKASVEHYIPSADIIEYRYEDLVASRRLNAAYDLPVDILAFRPTAIRETLEKGYDKVLFLGADVEFFDLPWKMLIDGVDMVVTPHFLQPKHDTTQAVDIARAGQFNTDCVMYNNTTNTRRFLRWQEYMHENLFETNEKYFYDQTWLGFCTSFCDVKVVRDPAYNYAYWRYRDDGDWDDVSDRLVSFQYSGS